MDKLDILLQQNPIKTVVRKELTQDIVKAMIQVKRIRLAKRMIGVLFVISLCFLIGKWINNDIVYLLQLLVNKFAVIKNQSALYWSALSESLPKEQLLSIGIAGVLWMGWRQFETYLFHKRITNTMIRLTPRLVFLTVLITLSGIGFAGYSYAQKTEQKQLQILKEHINKSGRTAFETNIPADQCDVTNNPKLTNQYEIKKGAKINSEDLVKIIEAGCNNADTENFLRKTFPNTRSFDQQEINTTSIISQVVKREGDSISLVAPGVAYQPNPTPITYTLTKNTKVYKDKLLVSQNILKKGDIVMLMLHERFGSQETPTTLGVYIVPSDPEFKWYNLDLQHSLTPIATCTGNPQDHCSFTGSIDFFPSGGGEANTTNLLYKPQSDATMKEIVGVLIEVKETYVKIKSSSGRIFTVKFGSDPVTEFNKDRAKEYNNQKVVLGDTLLVRYSEPVNKHSTTLETEQIFNAVLMIEVTDKFDPVKKY